MNILCHGAPFCADWPILQHYAGAHTIRRFGSDGEADIVYDPATEDGSAIYARLAETFPPDLILFWTPDIYPPPDKIEEIPCRTAAFVSDWNVSYDLIDRNLGRYDVVCSDRRGTEILKAHGIAPHHPMPLYAAQPEVHKPLGIDRDIDVLFLGNVASPAHETRSGLIARLAAWETDAAVVIGSGFSPEDYGRLLNRSRIVVNHSIRGELNLRVFETLACGALPMIEEDNGEVHRWFTPGEDIVTYRPDDLIDTLEHLIAHPHEIETIAARAHAQRERWSGEGRLDELITFCMDAPASGRPFKMLPPAEQARASWRQFAAARDAAFRPCEGRYGDEVARLLPNAAVTAHIAAFRALGDGGEGMEAAARHAYEAHRRERRDVIHAINAATVFRALKRETMERRCLEAALAGDQCAGGGSVFEPPHQRFGARWRRAWAEGRATPAMAHAEARYRLAILDLAANDFDRAADHVAAGDRCDPDHGDVQRVAFTLCKARGDLEGAIASLDRLVASYPVDMEIRRHRVATLREAGRDAEADAAESEYNLMARRLVL